MAVELQNLGLVQAMLDLLPEKFDLNHLGKDDPPILTVLEISCISQNEEILAEFLKREMWNR